MQKIQQDNLAYLDQIAQLKREKEVQVSELMAEFRAQKEAILDKAQRDKHQRDDKFRETKHMQEKMIEQLRQKNTNKRLHAEKQFKEVKETLEKERDKLALQVAELTEKTTKEGTELEEVLEEKLKLKEELGQISAENQWAQAELQNSRKVRNEMAQEREDLLGDLKGHVAEIESVYQINRELKAKIKRLEGLLYGKNMIQGKR